MQILHFLQGKNTYFSLTKLAKFTFVLLIQTAEKNSLLLDLKGYRGGQRNYCHDKAFPGS
jgi:hypothetical protein